MYDRITAARHTGIQSTQVLDQIVHAHLKLVHVIPDRHPLSLVVGLSVKISQWIADLVFEKKIFDDRMRGYIVTHNVDFFSVRSRYRLHIADQPKRRRTLCLREISLPHELDRREQFPVNDKTARSSRHLASVVIDGCTRAG